MLIKPGQDCACKVELCMEFESDKCRCFENDQVRACEVIATLALAPSPCQSESEFDPDAGEGGQEGRSSGREDARKGGQHKREERMGQHTGVLVQQTTRATAIKRSAEAQTNALSMARAAARVRGCVRLRGNVGCLAMRAPTA